MKTKLFFLFLCMTFSTIHINACIEEIPSPYENPFNIVTPLEKSDNNIDTETIDFWYRYCNESVSKKIIEKFFDEATVTNYRPTTNKNAFISWLRTNKKSEALEYIGDCLEFDKILGRDNMYNWDYEKPDAKEFSTLYKKIKGKSAKGEIGQRYQFLKVRILAAMNYDNELIDFWNKNGSKLSATDLTRRIKGYVGGAYYRKHDYVKALDFFDSSCDPNSVAWCVEKLVGAKNLEMLYNNAPDSKAIEYILEDYINYLIQAVRSPESFSSDNYKNNSIEGNPQKGITTFLALADRALTEGKVNNPLAWATAKGIVQILNGDKSDGLLTLKNSDNLAGDNLSKDNYKRFMVWANLQNWDGRDVKMGDITGEGLKYLHNKALRCDKAEDENNLAYWEYGNTIEQRFLYLFFSEEVKRKFTNTNPGIVACYMQFMENNADYFNKNSFITNLTTYLNSELSDREMVETGEYIYGTKNSTFDKLIGSDIREVGNRWNEVMGTRLIRQGKFEEAAQHLKNVSRKYITTLAIEPYLQRGYYSALYGPYDFNRHDFSTSWNPYFVNNTKLDFCNDVTKKIKEYDSLPNGDEKARVALTLASLMHIASPQGDAWAISDYAHSIYALNNEMTAQCRSWLKKALNANPSDETKAEIYYAMLLLPLDSESNLPIRKNWQNDQYIYNLRGDDLIAMRWLKNNLSSLSDVPSFITGCDALFAYH